MTLATVEIFPLQFFYVLFCILSLFCVFLLFWKPIVDAKGEGETLCLRKKKGPFLVSQSVGFTLYGNVAAFNFCCCCLFNILLHDGLILCSGRARPCCRVVSRSQPSRYVNSISLIVYIAWLISFFTLKPWYSCAFSSGVNFVWTMCATKFFQISFVVSQGWDKERTYFPRRIVTPDLFYSPWHGMILKYLLIVS